MDNHNNIVDLNSYRKTREKEYIVDAYEADEYCVVELICVKCYKRWFGMVPSNVILGEIECPKCHTVGTIIDTGQPIPDRDDLMAAADFVLENYLYEMENEGENHEQGKPTV